MFLHLSSSFSKLSQNNLLKTSSLAQLGLFPYFAIATPFFSLRKSLIDGKTIISSKYRPMVY